MTDARTLGTVALVESTPELTAWLMAPEAGDLPSLDELLHRPAWQLFAACWGEPAEVFFPKRGESMARARKLCAGCTVRAECLAFAMADPEIGGWWGGTSERERRRMRGDTNVTREATKHRKTSPDAER